MLKFIYTLTLLCVGLLPAVYGQQLIHYWNFNNSSTEQELLTPSFSLLPGAAIIHTSSGSSVIQISSNTGQGFDTQNLNAQNGDPAGTHLRLNEPIGATLVVSLPTTGHTDIAVHFATRRSGQGAGSQLIAYSTDGVSFEPFDTLHPVDGDPSLQTLDFASIDEVSDNADFKIRITFEQGPGGTGGNNRFDNLTLTGTSSGEDHFPPTATFFPADGATTIPVDIRPTITFNEDVRLTDGTEIDNQTADNIVELRTGNIAGALVAADAFFADRVLTIHPTNPLPFGETCYVILKANSVEDLSGNAIIDTQSASFTTITQQTVFATGDIVPVAYRMNATATEDEVAFLTLVDILPGTRVQVTDAKYTTNATTQCPGGLTWIAPAEGVAGGTVISIRNDVPSTDRGTVTGSAFGLSSGGDQAIFYTGTVSAPQYVTALSANAWVETNTICSGSLSMLPETLEDGISSINLSTAPGSAGGLSVNAYYAGPQQGSPEELRALILDPTNWIAVGSGTAPQVWPAWTFPGPPAVLNASVASQRSLAVVFNRDLDAVSAEDTDNFSGIEGLVSIERTENGDLQDTLTLIYDRNFENGTTYTLEVSGIVDSEGRQQFGTYTFTFTYNTTIGFRDLYQHVREDQGKYTVYLNLVNPSVSEVVVKMLGAPYSTADAADVASFISDTLRFDGTSAAVQQIEIEITDDQLAEQTEYLVLELTDASGCTISGSPYMTIYIQDNDRTAPQATQEIALSFVSRWAVNNDEGAIGLAEIVAYDSATQRLFVISTGLGRFDIIDFSQPASPQLIREVDIKAYGGGLTSIAVNNGVVAVALPGINSEQDNGTVAFFDTDGGYLNSVEVGALPDMLVFTPDGSAVLTANEGQPSTDYSVDPEGSVSYIDISGGIEALEASHVTTIDFRAFNDREAELIAAGVRKTFAGSTLAQDLEPEYITVSDDSRKAWVTLQENNAIAEIDLETRTAVAIRPLGYKDYSIPGQGFDASDRNSAITIANWPVKGFYIPDAIANYTVAGETYIISANEGDEKEYAALVERTTVGSVTLDPVAFPNAAMLQQDHALGRFRITNLHGDTDGDGDYDELYAVGARSFSIWKADDISLVYDSGDDFEQITAADPLTAPIFNSDHEGNGFKTRSRAKGPEPEGVTIARIGDKYFAFITLERIGGVMVYNVTDPRAVEFVDYKNTRGNTTYEGDHGPEGIIYISGKTSADGKYYIVVANEVSGTLSVFELLNVDDVSSVDNEVREIAPMIVYPNPNSGERLFFNRMQEQVELTDLHGKLILSAKAIDSLSLKGLPAGTYILRNAYGQTQKLVIQR